MKNKLLITAAVLVLTGVVVMPKLVSAHQGDPTVQGPNYSTDRHEAMMEAIENNDYQAWQELMQGRGRMSELITEENFDRFAQAHRLAISGQTEEAAQIRQELGLGQGNGSRLRTGQRMGNCPMSN